MEQAVEQSRSQRAVVVEDLRPVLERPIRSNDRRTALVALADHLEQRIGAELVDRQVPQFIDDEETKA